MHAIRKQWVVVSIIRIILSGIIFRNDAVCCKIQNQVKVFLTDIFLQSLCESIFLHDLSDYQSGSDAKAAASFCALIDFRKILIWEVFQIVLIRNHHGWICFISFSDCNSFRVCYIRSFCINALVFIINIVRVPLFSVSDLTNGYRNIYQKIKVHVFPLLRCIYAITKVP